MNYLRFGPVGPPEHPLLRQPAAADGYVAMDQFQDEKIKEPRVQAFMKRVTLESVPRSTKNIPGPWRRSWRSRPRTESGTRANPSTPSHPQNPMTEEEIKEKIPPSGVEHPGPNPDRPDHRNGLSSGQDEIRR